MVAGEIFSFIPCAAKFWLLQSDAIACFIQKRVFLN